MSSCKNLENSSLKIIYLNVRSLKSKIDKFKMKLRDRNEKPDVIVFVETWLNKTTESRFKYKLPGYKGVFMSREITVRGGIAIFYRENLEIETLKLQHVGINHLMLIKLVPFNVKMLIIYRTTDEKCGRRVFWKEMTAMLEEHKMSRMIILGDTNMDVLKIKNPQHIKRFISRGFRICNKIAPEFYTRYDTFTIIDHVFTNLKTSVNVDCIDNDFSDHRMLSINAEI